MLTQAKVKELFDYDPETGHLIWRSDRGKCKTKGKVAGTKHVLGYIYIKIYGKNYRAHRLVWLWHYGGLPKNQLDHISGDRADNRIENLREATNAQNLQNQRKARLGSKSGYIGVSMIGNKWMARIMVCGKSTYIGIYDDPISAHKAYIEKKRKLHSFNVL